MLIFNNKADLRSALSDLKSADTTLGFVPTMGALHEGHLSLLKKSMEDNKVTVISIFVNPTQFNNADDLEKYPRTPDVDVEKIKLVSEDIIVFAPSVNEMYDGDTQSQSFAFDGLEFQMEGSHRPGHFDGVGTIVKKLFEIIEPDNAYFGEKDFQQLQIVRKLVSKNNMPVKVIGCPIYREPNGLAMSSRNERLSAADRRKASLIYKTLQEVKAMFGKENPKSIIKFVEDTFLNHQEFKLEYIEIAEEDTLRPINSIDNNKYRAFIAVFLSGVRLIDNISLN